MARAPSPSADPSHPPEQGPTVDYMRSSQARNWRFSAKQIAALRRSCNEAAIKRLEEIWRMERSLSPVEGEPEASSSSAPLLYTSVEEEQALIRYYLTRVHQLVKAFGLPEAVEATAITFIKRFYLRNTCMDFHPKNIVLTCLFLAAKAESNPVPLRHFATKAAGKDASQAAVQDCFETIQRLEFLVSQSLQFQFLVHGAHRALHGLFLDMQESIHPSPRIEDLHSLIEPARSNMKQTRFTDAEMIYTPSQIALACLRISSEAGRKLVEGYIQAKQERARKAMLQAKKERDTWRQSKKNGSTIQSQRENGTSEQVTELTDEEIRAAPFGIPMTKIETILGDIEQLIQEKTRTANGDVEQVKSIDKKLKACQNPENLTQSRIAHQREKEKQATLLGKRKNLKKEEDPFGDDDEDENVLPGSKKLKTGGLFAAELKGSEE